LILKVLSLADRFGSLLTNDPVIQRDQTALSGDAQLVSNLGAVRG